MGVMKTPGVYIVEKNAFPNSVVEVATAVPAFIGYTQKAVNGNKSLVNKPWRITSMAEFRRYYGEAPEPLFEIAERPADATEDAAFVQGEKFYLVSQSNNKYLLYFSMMLFFQNGGGPCYIVSVGNYSSAVEAAKLQAGITPLLKEQEPTMVVIPEAVLLAEDDCISVQQASLAHCGGTMRNRVAILDVWNGFLDRQDPTGDCIESFRSKLGINYLDFSAAYYPWLHTTIVQDSDVSFQNIANIDVLTTLLNTEVASNFVDLEGLNDEQLASPGNKLRVAKRDQMLTEITTLASVMGDAEVLLLHKTLTSMSPLYSSILLDLKGKLNLLPPAACMAGIYTMVDNARGVWKAPANVSLNGVVSPAVNISHDEQEDLNVTTQGKSINAIRSFIGEGTLVWGARTLDGNSLDWRYISVRRTLIMLEESIRLAAKAYVFEPNTANTWATLNSMISNFLTGIWKRGGLAGSVPADAFSVSVGLGNTMTSEDILEGILRITVLVAVTRPAEFIEITFQQQMQKS
ncbi:phage tail sheath C-terminal domain-containing protein [Shewanella sp. NKUCC06_TVS]|uniref:phage tail sheath C-terminal domain-containing protein n=1 Tax=Shewanella sp. NKUCC06_TVS TaxID=2842128 RepID=UPI001C5B2BF4|nr:phage tail sheath C-terminal domain-containing protein [Shewanella sp. NKUCC06_TVS]MBW3530715.1 phage tail sheath subtilisin-like domain-containing protein [Shewanella sp. NKUCC06_TVS]